jgi:hypothetical protein
VQVKLGSGTVITGMEEGMVGMCKGEVRLFRFAPHVAFDDPNKRFSRKPVKTGALRCPRHGPRPPPALALEPRAVAAARGGAVTRGVWCPRVAGQAVLYQIEVLGVLRPFTLPWYKEVVGVPGLVGCLVLAWAAYEAYKSYKRAQKRGKKKAK